MRWRALHGVGCLGTLRRPCSSSSRRSVTPFMTMSSSVACSSSITPRNLQRLEHGGGQHERLARGIGRRNVARDVQRIAAQREFAERIFARAAMKAAGEMRVVERERRADRCRCAPASNVQAASSCELAERLRVGGLRRLDAHRRQQRARVECRWSSMSPAEFAAARRASPCTAPSASKPPKATANSCTASVEKSSGNATCGTSSRNGTPVGREAVHVQRRPRSRYR